MVSPLAIVNSVMQLTRLQRRSAADLLCLQEQRFRELLRFVLQHSAYYRDQYRGIDPDRCRPTDLPTLSKRALMVHFDQLVTDPAVKLAEVQRFLEDSRHPGRYYLGKYGVWHTSGSEGQPAVLVQDRKAMALLYAVPMARGNALPKTYRNLVRQLFRRARVAVVRMGRSSNPPGAPLDYLPLAVRAFLNVLQVPHGQGMEQIVQQLNGFQPQFLSAHANVLERLAQQERAGRLHLRGRLLQLTSIAEPLSASTRQLLQDVFGVPVVDLYAMGECIVLSHGCPRFGGSHLNVDLAMLEVVDRENQPVPPGTAGSRVLVTNLCNRVQPLIRYEVNDVVTISPDPCPCGSPFPLICPVQGRARDRFWVSGSQVHQEILPHVFKLPLQHCGDLAEYQVVQTERNGFLVRLVPLPGRGLETAPVAQRLEEALKLEGLAGLIQFRLEVVQAIHPDPRSGKVQRMLSLVGDPTRDPGQT